MKLAFLYPQQRRLFVQHGKMISLLTSSRRLHYMMTWSVPPLLFTMTFTAPPWHHAFVYILRKRQLL